MQFQHMELILQSVDDLKCIVDVFASVVGTIAIQCHEDGIKISGMDPSHISLLQIDIDGSKVSYTCKKNTTLTLYSEVLQKILHTAKSTDQIMIYNHEKDIEHLVIILKNQERVQTYEIPLLHDDSDMIEATYIDYDVQFQMSSKTLHETCSLFQKISCENIVFTNPENNIIIKATSDLCSTETRLSAEENSESSLHIIKNEDTIEQEFSLSYISVFSKLQAISDKVSISVSEKTPILFHYTFSIGEAHFYVAPKFDD